MTLNEALALSNQPVAEDSNHRLFLVCGFQPLHLTTFLRANLRLRFPQTDYTVLSGLYGDLNGNLAKAAASGATAATVVIEWSDADPRLGLRSSARWNSGLADDIVATCAQNLSQFLAKLESLAASTPVALCGPTLPPLPLGHTPSSQSAELELALAHQAAEFLLRASRIAGVRVLSAHHLAAASPVADRLDAKMELLAGYPYRNAHADALARQLVDTLFPAAPMKGLITDLDDTLWNGIVGEIGPGAISWSQANHTQIHGLYQQTLGRLAGMGVLLAIASKNEQSVVKEALTRPDLLVDPESFFPVIARWTPKSQSVQEILSTWNIAADSVVFVDDSPMELNEVETAHPGIRTLRFPKNPQEAVGLFASLRDLFGKQSLFAEDRLRLASIRANAEFRETDSGEADPSFLSTLKGKVIFNSRKDPANKRVLDLINKTNQFNLNGIRITEGEWQRRLEDPQSICVAVSYEDKFGSLGTIGVLAGRVLGEDVQVDHWVLSCRAFSRRIEHRTLEFLFELTASKQVRLAFQPTERNQPLQEFLGTLPVADGGVLAREAFLAEAAGLPHEIVWENA